MSLSVVIPTLNADRRLDRALQSVNWADEIIVVDAGSTDQTLDIAARHSARVIGPVANSTVGAQRNAGIEAAKSEWVLCLDADEELTEDSRGFIERWIAEDRGAASLRRRNYFLGRELRFGGWGSDYVIRLFRTLVRYDERWLHEQPRVDSSTRIGATVVHEPYASVADQMSRAERYAVWAARDAIALKERRVLALEPVLRAAWRLFRQGFLLAGFLDGRRGLLLAWLSARASYLRHRAIRTAQLSDS